MLNYSYVIANGGMETRVDVFSFTWVHVILVVDNRNFPQYSLTFTNPYCVYSFQFRFVCSRLISVKCCKTRTYEQTAAQVKLNVRLQNSFTDIIVLNSLRVIKK